MGNKLCKKKDSPEEPDQKKSPFDRIITRLHLRPSQWKSDPHLNQKQVNRNDVNESTDKTDLIKTQALSKSSDWVNVDLEVPKSTTKNPKLSLIFNNNDQKDPPKPPPRNKRNLREKLEAVAKTSLQAFQAKPKPVEEPLFVKKKINYKCPICDSDEVDHNRDHHHHNKEPSKPKTPEAPRKQQKRRKNLSIVSLPNYNELKLTVVTNFDDLDGVKPSKQPSITSLPKFTTSSTGKLDTYITRCRSFGSLLPQQLLEKLKVIKAPADVESDDSFGGLEDWDLGLIEHYNPRDASLPRPGRKRNVVLKDLESLIVQPEETEPLKKTVIEPIKSTKPAQETPQNDHSNLMKILEQFSMAQTEKLGNCTDFIEAERTNSGNHLGYELYRNSIKS